MKGFSGILTLAVILVIIWLLASVTRFLAGALLNVVLLAAIVLFIVWGIQKLR